MKTLGHITFGKKFRNSCNPFKKIANQMIFKMSMLINVKSNSEYLMQYLVYIPNTYCVRYDVEINIFRHGTFTSATSTNRSFKICAPNGNGKIPKMTLEKQTVNIRKWICFSCKLTRYDVTKSIIKSLCGKA